ncbi:hypothetical protein [Aliirhizobium smilacinae]|uniref:Conjugal transfer protein TraA n=1 Tax=Aliirhizobium smilacinae TaxID=1395944 RepID=A0A5C4XPJ3_9HYPH|nr:hypothetical protein [Rhizobium smilacinae]TNM65333.1 hypothetical protein FHP24_03395 [Rhizobium smilacinae]
MADSSKANIDDWLLARASVLSRLKGAASGADDDWWKKSRRGPFSEPVAKRSVYGRGGTGGKAEVNIEMRQRFERLAGGAQPAVTKLLAFGGGDATSRVASYISRNGRIRLENEIGMDLFGRQVAADTAKEWTPLFSGGEKSRDLVLFQASFIAQKSDPVAIEASIIALDRAFEGRSFAVGIRQSDAQTRVEGVLVLNLPAKGRLEIDKQAETKMEMRLRETLDGMSRQVLFQYGRHGHGVRFAGSELRRLVETYPGQVYNEQGIMLGSAKQANQLAQRDWRSKLESRGPRDHMHLLISAPSEASKGPFEAAVRQFLFNEFGGHRYLFAIHDPIHDPKSEADGGKRPHLHAHALIATRSNYGDRLRVWVTDLDQWRASFSKCARDQGMAIEVTHRQETLQAPAYGYKDVRPVSFVGRTNHVGTSAAAQRRYDEKRSQKPYMSSSAWARSQAQSTRRIWADIASQASTAKGQAFAEHMLSRFDAVAREIATNQAQHASLAATSTVGTLVVQTLQVGQSRDRGDMSTTASGSEERHVVRSNEGRRDENPAGASQSIEGGGGEMSEKDYKLPRLKAGLASAMRNIVGVVQARRTEPQQAASDTRTAQPDLDDRAGSEVRPEGETIPGHGRASQQYEHIDLSQRPRHPAPDPTIEKMEHSLLAKQGRERVDERISQQQDRKLEEDRRSGRREDDRFYDR